MLLHYIYPFFPEHSFKRFDNLIKGKWNVSEWRGVEAHALRRKDVDEEKRQKAVRAHRGKAGQTWYKSQPDGLYCTLRTSWSHGLSSLCSNKKKCQITQACCRNIKNNTAREEKIHLQRQQQNIAGQVCANKRKKWILPVGANIEASQSGFDGYLQGMTGR